MVSDHPGGSEPAATLAALAGHLEHAVVGNSAEGKAASRLHEPVFLPGPFIAPNAASAGEGDIKPGKFLKRWLGR